MANKKAFVIDTNFIIQNSKLDEVIKDLEESFSVYVTRVSINERTAQQFNESKTKYEKLKQLEKDCSFFVEMKFKVDLNTMREGYEESVSEAYYNVFRENIIELPDNNELFKIVLDRAYYKRAPFPSADNGSDKGFKDTLIWLSLLEYFKTKGENTIVFVTDDSGFQKNKDILVNEFKEITGKVIEFKNNSYYKELTKVEVKEPKKSPQKTQIEKLPDLSLLRKRIHTVIFELCNVEIVDGWIDWIKSFELFRKVDIEFIKNFFEGLCDFLLENLFDESVYAEDLFNNDPNIRSGELPIPMEAVEKTYNLYRDVKEKYPMFINQFYEAVLNMFNQNYVPMTDFDDELPF